MKLSHFIIASLSTGVLAAPAPQDDTSLDSTDFEVIPGEGLPSLASLNLTTTDLQDPDFLSKNGLSDDDDDYTTYAAARFPNQCDPRYFVPGPKAQAISCRNYLKKLGTQPCKLGAELPGVPGTAQKEFCRAGVTHIYGHGKPQTSSYCKHVAIGATWSIQNCAKNGKVAGVAAAYGNGDLQVAVQKIA